MSKLTYTMFISFIGNTFLSILKILTGLFGRSYSLVADGIHTFSDMSTDLLSITDDNLNKDSDKILKNSVTVVTGLIILGLGLAVIYLSIKDTFVKPSLIIVLISLFTIIFKYILSTYVMAKGVLYNNMTLVSNARESDNDVISSVIVFLGLILMQFTDFLPYLKYTDVVVSIIVGLFVIKSGFDVLSHEINRLFGSEKDDIELLNNISYLILNEADVIKINSLKIVSYGPYNELKCSILLNDKLSLRQANTLTHLVEKKIRKKYPDIEYIIININPDNN